MLTNHSKIPPVPITQRVIYMQAVSNITSPEWLGKVARDIVGGVGQEEAVNGVGFDVMGDILLYRKITPNDRDRLPGLTGVDEIWITYAFGEDNSE